VDRNDEVYNKDGILLYSGILGFDINTPDFLTNLKNQGSIYNRYFLSLFARFTSSLMKGGVKW